MINKKRPFSPCSGTKDHASAVPPAIRRRPGALDRLNAAHTADPTQKPDGFVQTSGSREKARTVSGGCSHRPHPLLRRRKPGTARSSPVPPGKPGNSYRMQYNTAVREMQAEKFSFSEKQGRTQDRRAEGQRGGPAGDYRSRRGKSAGRFVQCVWGEISCMRRRI